METLTDVLQMLLRISPVREEAILTKGLEILESSRDKLDGLVHAAEAKTEEVAQAIEVPTVAAPTTAPTAIPAPTAAPAAPTVAGL